MRKDFTMIELIFVIVILGILAAVAIPRLAATRDDAEIAKAVNNINTLVSDVGSYYTSQGQFAANLADMTNVQIVSATGLTSAINAGGQPCIGIKLLGASAGLELTDNSDTLNGSAKTACASVVKAPGVKSIIDSKFNVDGKEVKGLKVGGTSDIKY